MSLEEQDRVEKVLKALIHPVRRRIIEGLARNEHMSYTEMMRYAGIEDSGTFAFHLRNLQGLVEKDERGEYKLTSEGWRAYNALKQLDLTLEEEAEVEKVGEVKGGKVFTISDRLNVEVDEKTLSELKSRGEKLLITDVLTVTIHKVPPQLLEDVLEGIMDCLIVNVPEELHTTVQLRSKDVLLIRKYKEKPPQSIVPTALGGLVSAIGTLASGITTSILKGILGEFPIFKRETITLELREDVKKPYNLTLEGGSGSLRVESVEGEVATAKAEVRDREDASLKWLDGELKASIRGGIMKLEAPVGIRVLNVSLEAGSMNLDLKDPNIEECSVSCESGSASVNLEEYSARKTSFSVESGSLSGRVSYGRYEGVAELEVNVESGTATIALEVPEDVGVKAESTSESGFSVIEINGFKGVAYEDPNFQSATSKLIIRGIALSGALRVKVERKVIT